MINCSRKHQRGVVIVESAFIFVALILGLVVVIEIGRVEFLQHMLAERARSGARFAALAANPNDPAVKNYVCYNTTAAHPGPGLYGLAPSMIVVETFRTPADRLRNTARVQLTIRNYPLLLSIPGLSGKLTLPPITVTAPLQTPEATD